MDRVIVEWHDYLEHHEKHEVTDEDSALELLRQADRAGAPAMVEFYREDGSSLSVGVGRSETVMCYQSSVDPPYWWTIGDPTAEGVIDFAYGGEMSEFARVQVVPKAKVEDAVVEYLRLGVRPTSVAWEAV